MTAHPSHQGHIVAAPVAPRPMTAPWPAPPPAPYRGKWEMNRDYVVSGPKVVDDRVVEGPVTEGRVMESRPRTPGAKKMVQSGSPASR